MTDFTEYAFDADIYPHKVRVAIDSNGTSWWIVNDVCAILGIGRSSVRRMLDPYKKVGLDGIIDSTYATDSLGRRQRMNIVSEFGLYPLILKSWKHTDAKRFKRWVTKEVLPSIRKTGSSSTTPTIKAASTNLPITADYLRQVAAEMECLNLQFVVVPKK